ncbi:MAG TPA: DUF167 family protein [Candidatus Paceibacterota bacterium]|uniref:Uncharacterized protein n=1 Tax=uncultured Parcubacteria bacterium Rifle_16ft_4_minimus_2958 TaxID=1665137 RepID=A0A0H4T2L7_9BACT|nr:putative protein, putative protein [uncultured Parcubacteria bacterium Rifle_16ft_4_minimus_2958]
MYIKVKVKTGQKKESLVVKNKDTFLASVKEPAERNMANKRINLLIAKHFKVLPEKVRIIKGQTAPSKILKIII